MAAAKSLVMCAFALLSLSLNIGVSGQDQAQNKQEQKTVDPKAWGGNHAASRSRNTCMATSASSVTETTSPDLAEERAA